MVELHCRRKKNGWHAEDVGRKSGAWGRSRQCGGGRVSECLWV